MSNYIFEFQGKQFTPDGLINVDDAEAHNKELERQQLEIWATSPAYGYGYVNGNTVDTWLGTKIGTIIKSNTYKNNFGKTITSIRMRGTNNAIYYGRYGSDWSQLCRFRKTKSSK